MSFRQGAYATVWTVEDMNGKFVKSRISTQRKNKDGEFEQDFSGYCLFTGKAGENARKLKPRDRIKIGACDVTTTYDKEKKKGYTNFRIFDFEEAGSEKPSTTTQVEENPIDGADIENPPF